MRLLVRDRRRTELTPAGEQLLADTRPLLASAEALRRRVTRGHSRFTVAFMPGLIVTPAARHPDLNVDVLRTTWADQTTVVHDGRADVSHVRLPINTHSLRTHHCTASPASPTSAGVAVFPLSTAEALAWVSSRRSPLVAEYVAIAGE